LVVTPAGIAEPRTLVATRTIGDRWLVESGLKEGDKLIVEGVNKVGPGMAVHALEATGSASGAK
jgi:membrane fusion protein (multidrug efflux system)